MLNGNREDSLCFQTLCYLITGVFNLSYSRQLIFAHVLIWSVCTNESKQFTQQVHQTNKNINFRTCSQHDANKRSAAVLLIVSTFVMKINTWLVDEKITEFTFEKRNYFPCAPWTKHLLKLKNVLIYYT